MNLTRDGELVVIHDNSIDRTSDHTGLTRDYTLAELKTFDFGVRFSENFKGTKIPTLREVLELVNSKSGTLLLNVEIKDMTHECVDKTVAMLHEYGLAERSVIACFDAAVIRYTKSAHPEMRTQGFPGRYMQNFTEETYDCMFGMGIPIGWGDCTDEKITADVKFARSRGILAWLFCADTPEAVRRCVGFGTDQHNRKRSRRGAGNTERNGTARLSVREKAFRRETECLLLFAAYSVNPVLNKLFSQSLSGGQLGRESRR